MWSELPKLPLFRPEKPALRGESGVDQAHRVTTRGSIDPGAGDPGIAKGIRLLMAGGATDCAIAGKSFVVKHHTAQRGTGIRDRIAHRRIGAGDIHRLRLVGVVREFGQIDHSGCADLCMGEEVNSSQEPDGEEAIRFHDGGRFFAMRHHHGKNFVCAQCFYGGFTILYKSMPWHADDRMDRLRVTDDAQLHGKFPP